MELRNIGIALSGGGIRATIFHLGLLKWLAENNMFEDIKRISSVSGASLCVGLIYSHNNLKWPSSEEFLNTVLPKIKEILLSEDLQFSALCKLIYSPKYWNKKANLVARTLERKWGVQGKLSELTGKVKWYTNCTTYETGKLFKFSQDDMGDYTLGYVKAPNIAISDVMAASAGFPILIGPYCLRPENYHWVPSRLANSKWRPPQNVIHLWDGGVYDNLGIESVFKLDSGGRFPKGVDSIIVSNASPNCGLFQRKDGFSVRNIKRLLDISMDQVAALHTRTVMDFIKRTNRGMYLKIGNTADEIVSKSQCSKQVVDKLKKECLSKGQAERAMNYPTTLRKPGEGDFWLLLQHGYEVAKCTYLCYHEKG